MVGNSQLYIRTFSNDVTERCDVELIEGGGHKRRIYAYEGPKAEIAAAGFLAGYTAGVSTLKPLTPQPRSKPGKKKR